MHTLVFDIGKTHKKCLIFDPSGEVVVEEETRLPCGQDEDGDPLEDLDLLRTWVLETFQHFATDTHYSISRINAAAYGASLVHVNAQAEPVFPLYDYLKPFPEDLKESFLEAYGPEEKLCQETASPWLGMLNAGLQMYRLQQHQPDRWEHVQASLHLPQYVAGLLSGQWVNEGTSMGCHTLLWDFDAGGLHAWVRAARLQRTLPTLVPTTHTLGTGAYGQIGVGIHDSSAALVPFFYAAGKASFLLISTGTWCITLNPFASEPLTSEELRRDCLCYLSFQGQPVKASRLFLGKEHEWQTRRLAFHFGVSPLFYQELKPDEALFDRLEAGIIGQAPFYPETMAGTGPFPEPPQGTWDLSVYDTYAAAYHDLMRALAGMVATSVALVGGMTGIEKAYVDGGFARNAVFLAALQRALPGLPLEVAKIPQATALGAALVVNQDQAAFLNRAWEFRKLSE
ncbi:MAG: hypothetical protein D6722_06200 [Bacteroidetes bacterium]|nr:MAG: hypothetical protein D6722_06200 [Bacteroidota bacterium]